MAPRPGRSSRPSRLPSLEATPFATRRRCNSRFTIFPLDFERHSCRHLVNFIVHVIFGGLSLRISHILAAIVALATATLAATIDSQTAGSNFVGNSTNYFGESFTTPGGGPWTDIGFNFYSNIPATTPVAVGTAFMLSEEYSGLPSGLSSSTPGFWQRPHRYLRVNSFSIHRSCCSRTRSTFYTLRLLFPSLPGVPISPARPIFR